MHGHLTVVILMSAERLADLKGLKVHIMCNISFKTLSMLLYEIF